MADFEIYTTFTDNTPIIASTSTDLIEPLCLILRTDEEIRESQIAGYTYLIP